MHQEYAIVLLLKAYDENKRLLCYTEIKNLSLHVPFRVWVDNISRKNSASWLYIVSKRTVSFAQFQHKYNQMTIWLIYTTDIRDFSLTLLA